MNNLVISLATRNRPAQLLDTIRRSIANWTHPSTRMIVQCDSDDYGTLGILTDAAFDERVQVNVQKREDTVAGKWNRALQVSADVYLIAADDDPYVTSGYDAKILEAAGRFPDGIGMVYGHLANASFSGCVAVTAKWASLLGYIVPEHFPYWFCDHWIDDIGRMAGRISFADIRSDQSKAPPTQEMREPAWWATWFDAAYLKRRNEALKVIDAIDEPDWRKELQRTSYPLIEFRSRWINDNVRAQSRALELNCKPPDARYQRVKDAAIAALPEMLRDLPSDDAKRFAAMLIPSMQFMAPPQAYPRAS